jgi:hypothetical protein
LQHERPCDFEKGFRKRKRGRPPLYADGVNGWALGVAREISPAASTTRGRQGHAHAWKAMWALRSTPASCLWPGMDAITTGPAQPSLTILEALGRLDYEEDIRAVAAELAEREPMTARETVRLIRRARGIERVGVVRGGADGEAWVMRMAHGRGRAGGFHGGGARPGAERAL